MRIALAISIALGMLGVAPTLAYAQGASSQLCVSQYLAAKNSGQQLGIATPEGEDLINQVAHSIGLGRGVITVVPCFYADQAFAWYAPPDLQTVPEGEYIIYNPDWLRQVVGKERTQTIAVFGHELGHFLNRHFTTNKKAPNVEKETDADRFAGCAVARLNGDFNQLDDLLQRIRPEESSGDYPSYDQSLAVAKTGFQKCGGKLPDPSPVVASTDSASGFLGGLQIEGPPVEASPQLLTDEYVSGNWVAETFWYKTEYNKEPVTLSFKADRGKTRIEEFALVMTLLPDTYDPTTAIRCSQHYAALKALLVVQVGRVKDRERVETTKPDLPIYCYGPDAMECKGDVKSTTTVAQFRNDKKPLYDSTLDFTTGPAKVLLVQSVRTGVVASRDLDANGFESENLSQCHITLRVSRK
ncbi:hypothetical protein OIU34_02495 [Pararhizobium sp. BT-229]|uniref:hypothetical protein n=1 Tax=Pararhizobium sp. BT-229 TaxID=2986923 RepID=UPI0021F7E592|nr:hypothetical protein [Pararhizobium sp. BT-229]MCV9960757.1 hypothetical protein [Pararhizobium sp. BT-229]